MTTLGYLKARGERLSIHCEGRVGGPVCVHYTQPSIDQLIQYLGVDFDITQHRAEFLSRFRCNVCGSRAGSLQVVPSADTAGIMYGGPGGAHRHDEPLPIEEATRRHLDFEAERKRMGIKTNAEIAAYWRKWRKDQELAAQGKGDHFIGPPNPWAHRKGRWL
jgi:hypothetical protein